jgi:hypothetical protein
MPAKTGTVNPLTMSQLSPQLNNAPSSGNVLDSPFVHGRSLQVRDGDLFVMKGQVVDPYVTNGFGSLYTTTLALEFARMYLTQARPPPTSDTQYWLENHHYQVDERTSGPHFACRIGSEVVVGVFPSAVASEGDKVKMVVSRIGENVLFAHAIMRAANGEVWLSDFVRTGRVPVAVYDAKNLLRIAAVCFVGGTGIGALLMPFSEAVGIGAITAAFATPFPAYAWLHDYIHGAGLDYNERIFGVLGFPFPRRVDLSRFLKRSVPPSRTGEEQGEISAVAYDLWAALRAHGVRV